MGWRGFGFTLLIGLSLLTAGLADFLFYKQVIGWTLGGFVAWLLIFILLRHGRALLAGRHRGWGWALSLMTAGLCVSLVLEPGVLAWLLSLMALGSLAMLARGGWSDHGLGWAWLGRLLMAWCLFAVRPVLDSRIVRRWHKRTASLRGRIAAMARLLWAVIGIVVPLLLSLLFLGLFALANPVVADWMGRGFEQLSDYVFNATEYISISRVLIWYLAGFACWGVLRHRPSRRRAVTRDANASYAFQTEQAKPAAHPVHAAAAQKRQAQGEHAIDESESGPSESVTPPAPVQSLSPPVPCSPSPGRLAWLASQYTNLIVRCLVAMNIVFALQLVLDSRYLVLGQTLPEGMTYAEYAHRGAYPLIVTALLAAAMVLAVFRPGGLAQRSVWARRLVLLWIAQNVVLVASAAWRLQAYVEVYTLTRLRIAAGVWMLMVAGCLFLLLWRIARDRDNAWLTGRAMGWGLCVLWVCSFVPFDPMIAHYNVRNCKELGGGAGPIDVAYLETLGTDAMPAIDYLIANMPPEVASVPPGEPERSGDIVRADYATRRADAGYESRDPTYNSTQSLGDQLDTLRAALSDELEEDLEGWRGWTVRRAWLRDVTTD